MRNEKKIKAVSEKLYRILFFINIPFTLYDIYVVLLRCFGKVDPLLLQVAYRIPREWSTVEFIYSMCRLHIVFVPWVILPLIYYCNTEHTKAERKKAIIWFLIGVGCRILFHIGSVWCIDRIYWIVTT